MTDNDEKAKETDKESPESSTGNEDASFPKNREGDWMLKPCNVYLEELKDCKSIGGRFYQNFYFGEILNCTQWKTDYENCQKWQSEDDEAAYNELLASEKKRRAERLKSHLANNVWKPRPAPPSDWAEPLPDWMVKRDEGTFLAIKQQEISKTEILPKKHSSTLCLIL